MSSDRSAAYVVRLTYTDEFQSWPDVFGPFDNYDQAIAWAKSENERDEVSGYAVDKLREVTS